MCLGLAQGYKKPKDNCEIKPEEVKQFEMARAALQMFTDYYCRIEYSNDLEFRCDKCKFANGENCLVKIMNIQLGGGNDTFGCMR